MDLLRGPEIFKKIFFKVARLDDTDKFKLFKDTFGFFLSFMFLEISGKEGVFSRPKIRGAVISHRNFFKLTHLVQSSVKTGAKEEKCRKVVSL